MDRSVYRRMPRTPAFAVALAIAAAGCSGGGTTIATPPSATTSGTGTGSGGTGTGTGGTGTGGTGTTGTPTPAPGSTATASATATATPSGSSTLTPTSALVVGPDSIDANLGTTAQIGILDPGYSGPITVNLQGNQLVGTLLSSVLNLQSGVLEGQPGTADVLDVDLAQLLSLGLLGQNGSVLNICETAKTPNVCQDVALTSNATANEIGSSLSSAVITPGTFQVLSLAGTLGLTNFENFTVTSSNNDVTVTNLGNGQYDLGAAAHIVPLPATATITVSGGGQTQTIPVMVL